MSTFGSGLWGGSGTGASANVGIPLSDLILPAYRIAGITLLPGVIPNIDKINEAIPALNRMVGSWNCSRPNIFTIRIDTLPCIAGKLNYTVGPGADFDMPRPQAIQNGVVVLPDGIRVQPPMYQMDDSEWAQVALQTINNSIPLSFYYDGSYDTTTGYGLVYLWPQSGAGNSIDWYTWQAIPTFQASTDQVALPPGYEEAITYGLAVRLVDLNPHLCQLDGAQRQEVRAQARRALAAINSLNSEPPKITSDYPNKRPGSGHFNWYTGQVVR